MNTYNDRQSNSRSRRSSNAAECMRRRYGAETETVSTIQTNECPNFAVGQCAHAEGLVTRASGFASHAQGIATRAKGTASSSSNLATIANNNFQTVIGKFNRASRRRNNNKRSDDAFIIGNGHSCARSNAFRVTFDGKVHTDQGGYFASPGTGYSEFFEWDDRHHPTDPVGYFVTLEGDKIKIAKDRSKDDFILGVVTAVPSVVGNAFENGLSNSYATDQFGRIRTNLVSMNDFIEINSIVRQGMREVECDCSQRIGDQSLSSQLASMVETTLISSSECNMTDVAVLASTCTPSDRNCTQEQSSEWAIVTLLGTVAVRDDGRSRVGDFVLPNNEGIARVVKKHGHSSSRQSNDNDSNCRQSINFNDDGGFIDTNVAYDRNSESNQSSERSERNEEGFRVLRRIDQNTILILFR